VGKLVFLDSWMALVLRRKKEGPSVGSNPIHCYDQNQENVEKRPPSGGNSFRQINEVHGICWRPLAGRAS
jgi:hypothetical protein